MITGASLDDLEELINLFLKLGNLGTTPAGGLLTRTGNLKTIEQRTAKVKNWVGGLVTTEAKGEAKTKFSVMAEAFVHVIHAIRAAGLGEQLVVLLVKKFSALALEGDETDPEYSDDE